MERKIILYFDYTFEPKQDKKYKLLLNFESKKYNQTKSFYVYKHAE